jgi:nicotinamide-nucleotide amidase
MVRLRPLHSAEVLSIGSELTVGETRDTNAGDIARGLTELGINVLRIQALPDDLEAVTAAFREGLGRADVAISTGGLGPTPDDLTREAIADAVGESPSVDPDLENWLRGLWSRRGMPMPDLNLKQAWVIPSATALPNANGTAPGWWVDREDGRIIVALPGPPREMHPIWQDAVLPRLRDRTTANDTASRTFRLAGIGESAIADLLGEELLRGSNPRVATYARADAVDVRVSARPTRTEDAGVVGRSAREIVDETAARIADLLGQHVWAEGDIGWGDAIGVELEARHWSLGIVEVGTGGALASLLGDRPWLRVSESLAPDAPAALRHGRGIDGLEALATRAREIGGTDVAVGVRARPRGDDTAVSVVVIRPGGNHRERRLAFLGGALGRFRAGLAAADILLSQLRRRESP